MGTPVDPTPRVVQDALRAAADAPGYPAAAGSPDLQAAAAGWVRRRLGAPEGVGVLPVVGTKQLVALLPFLLDLSGPVRVPALAYPTYRVGALLAGRAAVDLDPDPAAAVGGAGGLTWLNSPSNPTGRVLSPAELTAAVGTARAQGAVVASDECYLEFGWSAEPPRSVLHEEVNGGDLTGLLALHSLSKRSNMAGYRVGVVAGDPALVARLLEAGKHAGLLVAGPVQAAAVAALGDETHVGAQRARYRSRRAALSAAFAAAGFSASGDAGLYLWCSADEDCWTSVKRLAELGILVAPGVFYGPAGERHVRVALTATDERVGVVGARLAAG